MSTYNIDGALRTGDVAIYKRSGPVGWLITTFTGGDRSHAGIILCGWNRHWVCAAKGGGIELRPLSNDIATGSIIRVRRVPDDVDVTPDMAFRLASFAVSKVGVYKYGLRKMLMNAVTETVGVPAWARDPQKTPTKAMCSEWVSLLLRAYYAFDPCPKWPDRYTTPDDLDRKSGLVTVCDHLTLVNK